MQTAPEIDAVYAWVDGTDPAFSASLLERQRHYRASVGHCPDPESVAVRRFRDNDNLRYSLRSIEKNAPWFRRIFIVTNGQVPNWFRPGGRAQIVTVDEIFPDRSNLPTFNAMAIEWNIHRIDGLARYYVFMNDDYFFSRPTPPDYFFGQNGRPKLLFYPHVLNRAPAHLTLWNRLLANQANLLSARFGEREWREAAHGPFIFDSAELARLREIWPEEIRRTIAHPFRDDTDLHMQTLYVNAIACLDETKAETCRHQKAALERDDLHMVLVEHENVRWRTLYRTMSRNPSRFLCLNDDGPDEGFEKTAASQRKFLERLFPEPSAFEERPASPGTLGLRGILDRLRRR